MRPHGFADPRAARARDLDLGEAHLTKFTGNHVITGNALEQPESDICPVALALANCVRAHWSSLCGGEPAGHGLPARLVEQQVELGTAEEEVLIRHGVLRLD